MQPLFFDIPTVPSIQRPSTWKFDLLKQEGRPFLMKGCLNEWPLYQDLRALSLGKKVFYLRRHVANKHSGYERRLERTDTPVCTQCHDRSSPQTNLRRRMMYEDVDFTGIGASNAMTWDFFKRLRDTTRMKILVKGLLAYEDAKLAADTGLDGIIVSNHGRRSEDSGRSTIDALPEIVEAVNSRIPILIDGGFRRSVDIVKALTMGAQGICVGRPYIWASARSARPASSARSNCCAVSCGSRCSKSGHRPSSTSSRQCRARGPE